MTIDGVKSYDALLRMGAVISFLVIAAVWQLVASSGLVPPKYFPGIPAIAGGFWSMLTSSELPGAELKTLSRALTGLAGASILGIALAVLSDLLPVFRRGFAPVAALIQPIPPAALVPMAVFMLGLGPKLYAFIIILVTVWPPYFNGVAALASVSQEQIRSGQMMALSRWQILWRIKLPAALPEIFAGIRYASTISLIAVVVAEMLAGHDGLGFLLIRKAFAIRIPEVYALMFVCAANGLVMNGLIKLLRWQFTGWHMRMIEQPA
ncbi:ABC transporter permease [Mesorhizobium sp. INR15]|uniref:ABC transporter permease n=1 Tax=Mesorhizobium sp. INR15 TaxID=2654248 RepID=UPI00189641A2|nr:ABC transporter permease [Mesorhizobium sp. INR15]QPC94322.1 ABC transporter permease subunit [Mesorhizobium sp. INR15]